MEKRTFKAGGTIYCVGDVADGIYVVKKGSAEFFVPLDDQQSLARFIVSIPLN